MKVRVLCTCLLALALSAHAWAQAGGTSASGSLWGKITDETGAVLPGVTVTVEGPRLMGVQTAVSNEQGIYLRGVNYFCRLATTISAGEGPAKEC